MANVDSDPAPLPSPTPSTAPPRRQRWSRSDDRVVLGVAGGLGRALAIEPLLIRIAFVVLALFGGVGVLLYVAGLALLADSPTSPPPSALRRVGGGVAAVGSIMWMFSGDAHLPDAGWVVALGLLGGAVALWRGHGSPATDAPPFPPTDDAGGGSAAGKWAVLTADHAKPPRPPRSALGMLTIGAAAVVGAAMWLFNGDSVNRGAHSFGMATVVLGSGLLIGTFAGRARWLIVPAIVTACAAVGAAALSFAGVGLTGPSGDTVVYAAPGQRVSAVYRSGIGDVELWLADHPTDVATSVEVGIGDVTVVVPDNAQVRVDAQVGLGEIDAFDSTRSGYRRSLSLDTRTGGQLISLRLRAGVGRIEVRRASAADRVFTIPTSLAPLPTIGVVPIAPLRPLRQFDDGTVLFEDGSIGFADGRRIEADGRYQLVIVSQNPDGSVQLDNGAMINIDGTVISPGGFVIERPERPLPPTSTIAAEVQP